MHPLKDGVISDHELTVKMLQTLFHSINKSTLFSPKPRVVIAVPSGITEVEERTVINAAAEAGSRRVYLIEEPLAAALGANLPIEEANGHMVVDVGGGTTDIAVLSLNGVANSSSVEAAGDAFDEAIARHVRRKHGVVIGQVTAEEIKIQIGCVWPRPEDITMSVKGRDAKTGLPREILLYSSEIYEVLRRPARMITDEVLHVLEETSPELVGDIAQNGITLTGGGSQIWGMDQLIADRTAIACTIADDPDFCVVYGCGKAIGWINDTLNEGPINLARRRIMRE
jgi:rod shape-determining protein MreB